MPSGMRAGGLIADGTPDVGEARVAPAAPAVVLVAKAALHVEILMVVLSPVEHPGVLDGHDDRLAEHAFHVFLRRRCGGPLSLAAHPDHRAVLLTVIAELPAAVERVHVVPV